MFSIALSMTMVVSRGTIMSYSTYRSAAICNFLCFALDIVGIFCVTSWLFCTEAPEIQSEPEPFMLYCYAMWRCSYYYFSLLFCAAIGGFAGVCVGVQSAQGIVRYYREH